MVIKIFSDKRYLPAGQGHIVMLYPFWGKNPEDPRDPSSGRFDRYAEIGSRFFQMTTLAEADVAVLPMDWGQVLKSEEAMNLAMQFVEAAHKAGKRVVIFFLSDSDADVPIENSIIFRTSFYRSRKKPNEFAMSVWSEDFVMRYFGSQLSLRPKRERPVVGFCGYVPSYSMAPIALRQSLKNVLRTGMYLIKYRDLRKSHHKGLIRAQALQMLAKNSLIETNFVIRDLFWGSYQLPSGDVDFATMQRYRQEYVRNIVESDYSMCARGMGNYSYRLYETLSCGRIPIFIDTDCVLPYQSEIEWKKYCVWIDEKDIGHIGEKVYEFHEALSSQDFSNLQRECRKLWEDWLSPEGFFANFYRYL